MKVCHRGPATISDQYRIFRIASIQHRGLCRRWLLFKSIASRCHQEDPTVRQEQQGESPRSRSEVFSGSGAARQTLRKISVMK
ncbi:hypothetical protein Bca52824_033221 [Brassica carinata]|uniref:Uncharacterized protein n=1 Tax=Brassica carinata TaxID=52824 RepID=A0A8X7SFL6_BRACI|nr:hypothetical protein Bca52824_033221 [Brassica carinata]